MLITLIGLGTGCRAMTGRSLGTNTDDLLTTAQVKTRLSVSNVRNITWVDVDTKHGVVFLSGTARSEADRQQAEAIARGNAGVRQVVNNIVIAGASASASPSTVR
jgi:osmotically-inducible protein OsmY